jgi:hypothetical protein
MFIIFLPTTSTRNGGFGIFVIHFLNSMDNFHCGLDQKIIGQIFDSGDIGILLLAIRTAQWQFL